MLADIVLMVGCFVGSGLIYFGEPGIGRPLLAVQLLLPLYLTIALHNATYSIGSLSNWRSATLKMASAMLIAAALLNFLAFFVKLNAAFSRVVFVAGLTSAMILMGAARVLISGWVTRYWGPSPNNILQIDAGGPALRIAKRQSHRRGRAGPGASA
jgi:FlaA1/EpsC-like NDP-sugar epimerase